MEIENTVMYRWFEYVWNRGNEDVIDEMMSPDATIYGLPEGTVKGSENFKTFYNNFRNEFSNIHVKLMDVIQEDDMEYAKCFVTAHHNKTGIDVSFTGSTKARLEGDVIVESWNDYDFAGLSKQVETKKAA